MARILYGFAGEGSGHSARAETVANHLYQQGHEVLLVSYDRGYRNLKPCHQIEAVEGFSLKSRNNRISLLATFWSNLKKFRSIIRSVRKTRKLAKDWRADMVISDFELTTAYTAHKLDLPLITVDNQHQLLCAQITYPRKYWWDVFSTKLLIKTLVPKPDYSLITCLDPQNTFKPKVQKTYPPLLRESVLHVKTSEQEHVLVYLTHGYADALRQLKLNADQVFYVYGYDRDDIDGNLHFKPFSVDGFLDDLASCKAVIATAGFALMSEAIYLQKPILALPMQGQFEQVFNALELERIGLGRAIYKLSGDDIAQFMRDLPIYTRKLDQHSLIPNGLLQGLDNTIKKILKHRKKQVKKMKINIPGKNTRVQPGLAVAQAKSNVQIEKGAIDKVQKDKDDNNIYPLADRKEHARS